LPQLGVFGASTAGRSEEQREQIIETLVKALNDPRSQREIVLSGESKGKLEDTLYSSLLQVAGL
jgi:hypothetical protein